MPAAFHLGCAYAWNISRLTFPTWHRVVIIGGGAAQPFRYAHRWPKASLHTSDGIVQIWFEPRILTRASASHRKGSVPSAANLDHSRRVRHG
jgi:hypothetical protein